MTASRQPYRSKSFVWKAIFALVVLINYSAMIYVFHHLSSSSSTAITTSPGAAEYPSNNFFSTAKDDDKRILDNDNTMMNYQTNEETTHNNPPPRILLAGMAFSDNTISDYALSFLIHSACTHHIHTHILLATRDTNTPLTKKIEVLSTHYFQPLPSPVDERQQLPPSCRNFIHVEVAPSEEELVNMTKSYHNENHSGNIFLQEDTPNNPWNEQNRIARIKRSREYQRQLVIRMLNNSNNNNDDNINNNLGGVDWTTSQDAVIGVLDLDLFDYPSPEQLIDSAREYIVMTKNNQNDNGGGGGGNTKHEHSHSGRQQQQQQRQHHTGMKYHAICSNGLFVMKSRGYNGYRRRYYDTFSTILLPNSWLHVDRERPRGSLVGEDVTMAKMNQDKTLQWILKEGRRSSSSQLPSQSLSISGNNNNNDSSSSNNNNNKDNNNHGESQGEKQEVQYQYVPVPVRSCFNGLTLYRADVWLEPQCRYDSYHKDDDAYLSKRYQHACEHIVFHECLRRVLSEREGSTGGGGDGFNIAVQPDLTTLWHYLS